MIDQSRAVWCKSSRSGNTGQCVELALNIPGVTAVRDSKAPEDGTLTFEPHTFRTFLTTLKSGKLDS
ncbi:DUF397 domain-containing protein [Saccharopolyspora flava]|uniref:DUF397 domain-containing protein n=1 Tax=Saccharopolyspora flava TaxID=95161 RepID=A0A1I6RTB6_9PSEU|nr:DUF397 domain-containing protein [Saccharopolyspora flava]SFS67967.1 protein of unknown function [Saccharopolyspora flava]